MMAITYASVATVLLFSSPTTQVDHARIVRFADRHPKGKVIESWRLTHDPAVREAYVQEKEKEAEERRGQRGKTRRRRSKAASGKRSDLIALETPEGVAAGKPLVVKVRHKLEAGLGEQLVHVTLKAGPEAKRVARKVVKVSGDGVAEVTFDVPASVPGNVVHLAAFIGEDYASNRQHLQTAPVPVR